MVASIPPCSGQEAAVAAESNSPGVGSDAELLLGASRIHNLTAKMAQMQREVINEMQLLEGSVLFLKSENSRLHESLATYGSCITGPLRALQSTSEQSRRRRTFPSAPSLVMPSNIPKVASPSDPAALLTGVPEAVRQEPLTSRHSASNAAIIPVGTYVQRQSEPCRSGEELPSPHCPPASPTFLPVCSQMDPVKVPQEKAQEPPPSERQSRSNDRAVCIEVKIPTAHSAPPIHYGTSDRTAAGNSISPPLLPPGALWSAEADETVQISEDGSSDTESHRAVHSGVFAPRVQTWSPGENRPEFDSILSGKPPLQQRLEIGRIPAMKGLQPQCPKPTGLALLKGLVSPRHRANTDDSFTKLCITPHSFHSDSKRSDNTDDSGVTFKLLDAWSTMVTSKPSKSTRLTRHTGRGLVEDVPPSLSLKPLCPAERVSVSEEECVSRFALRNVMMHPSSAQSMTWDLICMLLVCYDLVLMPMQVFDPPPDAFTRFVNVFARLFWTLTVPRSFFVGYMQKDGEVEMTPTKVMRHYVCGWMCFDALIAISDWAAVVMEGIDFIGAVRVTKVVRFLRIIRIMRVARVLKMPALVETFVQRFHSEKLILILSIAKYSCMFAIVGHWIACVWFALGTFLNGGGESWTRSLSFEDETFSWKYTTSFHWAMTQFIGSMEVYPHNVYERTFAVCTLIVSFIGSAAFISRITASMTRLQIIAETNQRQTLVLRNFLFHHKVSPDLKMRVIRCARFALELHEKNAVEQDIELLNVISEPLRVEIHYQIYTPVIKVHPFFRHYHACSAAAMQKLCHTAIQVISLSLGDTLFTYGETPRAPQIFFLMSGSLGYRYQSTGDEQLVGVGMWACEAALWVSWIHLGDMSARADCGVLCLHAEVLQEVSMKFPSQSVFSGAYASRFVKWLNEQDAATDLPPTQDCEACVAGASSKAREDQPPRSSIGRRVSISSSLQSGSFWR